MSKKKSLNAELSELDQDIAELLARRTKLLAQSVSHRMDNNLALVNPEQEKSLWKIWQSVQQQYSLEFLPWRKLFYLLNNSAYALAEKKNADQAFPLLPSHSPVDIDMTAVLDMETTRLTLVAGFLAQKDFSILTTNQEDGLIELLKSLNQAGAAFSWDQEGIRHTPGSGLEFGNKTIFPGQDPLTLYLLVCLSLLQAGICKFSGSSKLKLLDFDPLFNLISQLGARVVSLIPQSNNLPFRLECSGQLPESAHLPSLTSPELAMSLALIAPLNKNGLRITWEDDWAYAESLQKVGKLLHEFNISVEIKENQAWISPGNFSFPDKLQIPMDPVLNSFLLAFVQVLGGKVCLNGYWPEKSRKAQVLENILTSCGLKLKKSDCFIRSFQGKLPDKRPELDLRSASFALPLAIALSDALQLDMNIIIAEEDYVQDVRIILENLQLPHLYKDKVLELRPTREEKDIRSSFSTPCPSWSLALALIALRRPGISIRNPGEMTLIWPKFWKIYKSLPCPQAAQIKQTPEKHDAQKQRRRRIVK